MRWKRLWLLTGILILACSSVAIQAEGDWRSEWNQRMSEAEKAWTGSLPDLQTTETEYRAALDLAENHMPGGLHAARSLDALAYFYLQGKRYEEAESAYLRSIPLLKELLGPEQPRVANSIHNLGVLYIRRGRNDLAEPLVQEALEIFTEAFGPDHLETARACRSLSVLMRRKGLDAEADALEARARKGLSSPDEPAQ